jgi:hypothetical protein
MVFSSPITNYTNDLSAKQAEAASARDVSAAYLAQTDHWGRGLRTRLTESNGLILELGIHDKSLKILLKHF